MEKRNLDGIYGRIKRGDSYVNLCLSDMTEDELDKFLDNRSAEWLKCATVHLATVLRRVGDEFDIVSE